MKQPYVPRSSDPDMQAVPIALMRAAQRARELARLTGTKLVVGHDRKLVELDPNADEPMDDDVGENQD